MKKIVIATLAIIGAMMATGCSLSTSDTSTITTTTTASVESKTQTEAVSAAQDEAKSAAHEFTEKDGVLTFLDTENCPFEETGFRITADTSAKTVNFVKTDLSGQDTVEYYTFDYNTNTVEQYYYVSAMGTGYYYTYDLSAGEIIKIEDTERNDKTQSTKDKGRYDSANERMQGDVAAIEKYFSEQFGKTIADMANGK